MKKVFELNVDIFLSKYKERVLVEADNESDAVLTLRRNFHEIWTNYFSNYVFYEYKTELVDEVKDIDKYKDVVIFSEENLNQ